MALYFFKKPTPLSKINENDMMILMTPSFFPWKIELMLCFNTVCYYTKFCSNKSKTDFNGRIVILDVTVIDVIIIL